MTYSWSIHPQLPIPADLLELAQGDSLLARILLNRGVATRNSAIYYLGINEVIPSDPLEIPEMDKAFRRIKEALAAKQKILIYGDYDVDGTSSVALLYRAFLMLGYQVSYYIPSRHTEGYGINKEAIRKIREDMKIDLMISCDCGISNYDEVAYANTLGLDVIITDHHSIPSNPPPSIANCNPKTLPIEHPLHYLPGVGVAYKLAELLLHDMLSPAEAKVCSHSLLDLVALGMIADLAPLRAENRYLTQLGLKVLTQTSKIGLQELLQISRATGNVDTESIGFGLAPRINAAGRLADAERAVRLMISEDLAEAKMLCEDLDDENRNRQVLCNEIQDEALRIIAQDMSMLDDNVIVLAEEGWHHGVIGIVASRLLDKFHLPVFIMAIDDSHARGSVRCINVPNLDIYEEMKAIQEQTSLFSKFGGHRMAAGFSVAKENIPILIKTIRERFRKKLADENLNKRIKIDAALRLHEITPQFIARLAKLAPYGIEHAQASFISGPLRIESMRLLGKEGKHIKLFLSENLETSNKTKKYEAVIWNRAEEFLATYPFGTKAEITIVYTPRLNEFNGDVSIQLDIKDWKDPAEVGNEFFERFTPLCRS